MNRDVHDAKQQVRDRIWALLEREHAAPSGVQGYIPAFTGADVAATRLAALPMWTSVHVVKAVPDRAQQPVRAHALRDGKIVYMAVPRLAEPLPFYRLDPAALSLSPEQAADRHVAATIADPVGVNDMSPVDLVVCGSVAVNPAGVRLGKGAGYSDLEFALLQEAGLIQPSNLRPPSSPRSTTFRSSTTTSLKPATISASTSSSPPPAPSPAGHPGARRASTGRTSTTPPSARSPSSPPDERPGCGSRGLLRRPRTINLVAVPRNADPHDEVILFSASLLVFPFRSDAAGHRFEIGKLRSRPTGARRPTHRALSPMATRPRACADGAALDLRRPVVSGG
jgi:5-formyltetrahydrofolate cyclo-ligase